MGKATASIELTVTENGKKAPQYTVDSDINGEVTLQDFFKYTKQVIQTISKNTLEEEQAKGFDPNPVIKVDNKFNKPIHDVNPLGQVEYIARQDIKNMLTDVYEAILTRSRVSTGRYLNSNIVLFNDTEVANNRVEFAKWLDSKKSFIDTDKIRFINIAPYANRLELDGTTSSGTTTRKIPQTDRKGRPRPGAAMRKPNGVYTLAMRSIRRLYKDNSLIKYGQTLGSTIGLITPERGSGVGRIRQRGRSKGRPYVYPTITVYVQTRGVTQ